MTRKKWFLMILVLLLAAGLWFLRSPKLQAQAFVAFYGDSLEESITAGNGIPAGLPVKAFNTWEGTYTMTEFLLSGRGLVPGSQYFGCYYSPADVPLPFQNAPAALTPAGRQRWTWQGKGDNRGMTERIRKNWYYFEASF